MAFAITGHRRINLGGKMMCLMDLTTTGTSGTQDLGLGRIEYCEVDGKHVATGTAPDVSVIVYRNTNTTTDNPGSSSANDRPGSVHLTGLETDTTYQIRAVGPA